MTLKKILDLNDYDNIGSLGKYYQSDTIDALISLLKTQPEVSSVCLISGTSLRVHIIVATRNHEMYRIRVQRPTVSECKNIREWLSKLCDAEVFVSQINDRLIWLI